MRWLVTLKLTTGAQTSVEVIATNKADAEYRAAFRAEDRGQRVERVIVARKVAA